MEWLREFLCPPFREFAWEAASPPVPGIAEVHWEADEGAYLDLLAQVSPEAPLRATFQLDSHAMESPCQDTGEDLLFLDCKNDALYRVDAARKRMRVLTKSPSFGLRTCLLRGVREWAMDLLVESGALILHSAAVASGDRLALFLGTSNAGKTSLLFHSLRSGFDYVSNDRVAVFFEDRDEAGIHAVGIPTIATVRRPMLKLFPGLESAFAASTFQFQRSLAECQAPSAKPLSAWEDGRFGLTPVQLCDFSSAHRREGGGLRALILPQVTGQPGGIELSRLALDAASPKLEEALFGPILRQGPPGVFGTRYPSLDRARAMLKILAESVPTYVARLGQEAYSEARFDALRRLLDA